MAEPVRGTFFVHGYVQGVGFRWWVRARALELMRADRWDAPLLAELSQVMRDASICGLGQAAPNAPDCVLRYFPEELA